MIKILAKKNVASLAKMSSLKSWEWLPQCMLRLAQGALGLAHSQLRLKA